MGATTKRSGDTFGERKNRQAFLAGILLISGIAFVQCYRVTHDLNWPVDGDQYRDISFVQQMLDGHFGKDPTYAGHFLWYNPLLTFVEAALVKISGLPIHIVIVRAGIYLNLLGPVFFSVMMMRFFNYKVALAALMSYLFFASGNLSGENAATYSPWLFPSGFAQFFFYLNMLLLYKAYTTERYGWFTLLGFSIGISFLGHTAPTLLIILILTSLHLEKIFRAGREKNDQLLKKRILQGLVSITAFAVASLPLTFFIIGKYHLRVIHPYLAEWRDGIFIWSNFKEMIKANISVSFIIAAIGFWWFYKNFHEPLIRKLILRWLSFSVILYVYTTMLPKLHEKISMKFPDTVSSFHYFFAFKAVQSVFFGFGFVFIFNRLLVFIQSNRAAAGLVRQSSRVFIISVTICSIIYFPFYRNRYDFVHFRSLSRSMESDTDRINVYHYILREIPSDKVVLCEDETAIFPVMATARKMVVTSIIFSNPYVNFWERYNDRDSLLQYFKTGSPPAAKALFRKYHADYLILPNDSLKFYPDVKNLGAVTFKNNSYTVFALSFVPGFS